AAGAGGTARARNGGVRGRGRGAGGVPRAGRRDREAAVRFNGTRDGAGDRRRYGVPRVSHAGNAARRILCPADHRSRRLRRAGLRGGEPRDRRDRAQRAGLEVHSRARRARAACDARARANGAGPRRGPRGGGGLCGRRSAARARRHRVRRGGERDSRMARPAGGDVARRRRGDRRVARRTRGTAVSGTSGAAHVAAAAQLACLLEVSAPKPGNVSPFAGFRDASYEDFLASAAAIGPALTAAGERPLGATIRAAVEATARWVPSNTNLGLVLLLAPLARAALTPGGASLRDRLAAGDAVVETYLTLLAAAPDTHIARKLGLPAAVTVQQRGRSVLDAGGVRTAPGREAIAALDGELRDEANTLNPGATADLTGA